MPQNTTPQAIPPGGKVQTGRQRAKWRLGGHRGQVEGQVEQTNSALCETRKARFVSRCLNFDVGTAKSLLGYLKKKFCAVS